MTQVQYSDLFASDVLLFENVSGGILKKKSIKLKRFIGSNTGSLMYTPQLSSLLCVSLTVHLPHDYDDEVEQIPAVPQVGVGVEEQAIGYYLQERLHRENDEEQILHTLLQRHKHKTAPFIGLSCSNVGM